YCCAFLRLLRHPRRPPLFPYTTLFRSALAPSISITISIDVSIAYPSLPVSANLSTTSYISHAIPTKKATRRRFLTVTKEESLPRSEEHTSELQSRENLVCRLLLEKKKI